ncbi:hypothetical protein [Pseudomonas akapageensis]|uniref:hypothetical protein n=1 Tax=Pseudomonas akapageensis TaxID=2609961 RepID=UPI00140B9DE2|nr:hypothetical protein [Pseudomonas akapageensis]
MQMIEQPDFIDIYIHREMDDPDALVLDNLAMLAKRLEAHQLSRMYLGIKNRAARAGQSNAPNRYF